MTQPCPFCRKPYPIEAGKLSEIATAGDSGVVATQCCGKLLVITPRTEFDMVAYQGRRKKDDYGTKATA